MKNLFHQFDLSLSQILVFYNISVLSFYIKTETKLCLISVNFIFYPKSAVFQIKNIHIFQKGYRNNFDNYSIINLGMLSIFMKEKSVSVTGRCHNHIQTGPANTCLKLEM